MADEQQILVVTSSAAPAAAVVPVLAAIEAAGMRVRAVDVGNIAGGSGVADRMRRALLGEGAERKLRKELELTPPDAAIVFDPYSASAMTAVRDQVMNPAPVIAVVGELEPAAAWGQTDADRYVAVDELSAVALADAGVEGDRILVVGAIGERAYADAGAQDRAALKTRFKLSGRAALVDVGGLGAELTGQLSMQLSLLDTSSAITFLFDAGSDADAAAVLRRQVPALGLRGKLFGASSADGPLLWRAADVVVARPRPEVISRVLLVGGKLVALIDDAIANGAQVAASLEARKRAIAAKGLLLLSSALDSAFTGALPPASDDGADQIADIVAVVAGDKLAVIDERRLAAHSATRERVATANAAAKAAAAQTAMPGDLEDLGGGGGFGGFAEAVADLPDRAELERLRGEVAKRVADLTKSMVAARDAATDATEKAKGATARGAADEATQLERKADAERARMHALLAELATLEAELKDLERSLKALGDLPPRASSSSSSTASSGPSSSQRAEAPPRPSAPPRSSIDDELARLKRQGPPSGSSSGGSTNSSSSGTAPKQAQRPSSGKSGANKAPGTVDDELAALKKKMQSPPPKKKP